MRPHAHFVALLLAAALVGGCASESPLLTESYRTTVGEHDLQSLVFHVSAAVEFRSLRQLDSLQDAGPFRKTGHRSLLINETTSGRIMALGEGWLAIDFGEGIVLRFARRASDGVYATPGWGTVTIQGERYDLVVGIMSGKDVVLRVRH